MASIFSTRAVACIVMLSAAGAARAEDGDIRTADLSWTNDVEANFLNYEWKDEEVEGETFFNTMLKSVLVHSGETVHVELGLRGIKRFGEEDNTKEPATEGEPWLQIRLQPVSEFQFLMGSLNDDHQAHEALIAPHRRFQNLTEEGFQIRYDTSMLKTDFWLNWQRRESQKKAEQFEVGSTNSFTSTYLELELQYLAHHIDGQKTEDTTSLRNNVAMAGGALKLPLVVTPKVGGRFFHSKYKLNESGDQQGRAREIFTEIDATVGTGKTVNTHLAKITGDQFQSLYTLQPYSLPKYDFIDISYDQVFFRSDNKSNSGSFGFRARFERFKDKPHTSQEMTLSASF